MTNDSPALSPRKSNLITITEEVSVKMEKLTHEAEMAAVRSAIANANNQSFLLEERICALDSKVGRLGN